MEETGEIGALEFALYFISMDYKYLILWYLVCIGIAQVKSKHAHDNIIVSVKTTMSKPSNSDLFYLYLPRKVNKVFMILFVTLTCYKAVRWYFG